MKTKIYCCLVLLLTISALPLAAQTADEIINHNIDSVGGAALLGSLKSIVIDASYEIMGNESQGKTYILDGVGYRNELDFNGSKIIQAVSANGGWVINPMAGAAEAQPMPDADYQASKEAIYIGGPFYKYAEKGSKAELLPNEKTGNIDAYKVKLTTSSGTGYTFWIDPATYYILKMERSIGEQVTTTEYSDYRKDDKGYVSAYAMAINLPQGFAIKATVNKIELNPPIDTAIFDMPK